MFFWCFTIWRVIIRASEKRGDPHEWDRGQQVSDLVSLIDQSDGRADRCGAASIKDARGDRLCLPGRRNNGSNKGGAMKRAVTIAVCLTVFLALFVSSSGAGTGTSNALIQTKAAINQDSS